MAIVYNVKAGIVNQGNSEIERPTAKILRISNNTNEDFIKTYPFSTERRNFSMRTVVDNESKSAFIGISFICYRQVSFIQFSSTLKSFPLNQGDQITLFLENEDSLEFIFYFPKSNSGFVSRNIHPLRDVDLELLSRCSLDHWQLVNKEQDYSLIGGFAPNDDNKQYKSPKIGQKILQLMAENIIRAKKMLPDY